MKTLFFIFFIFSICLAIPTDTEKFIRKISTESYTTDSVKTKKVSIKKMFFDSIRVELMNDSIVSIWNRQSSSYIKLNQHFKPEERKTLIKIIKEAK